MTDTPSLHDDWQVELYSRSFGGGYEGRVAGGYLDDTWAGVATLNGDGLKADTFPTPAAAMAFVETVVTQHREATA